MIHRARPQLLDRVVFRTNRFAVVITVHIAQFMAPAGLPQQLAVALPCFLDLRRELAPQMHRNRRVIGARPQVRNASLQRLGNAVSHRCRVCGVLADEKGR